MSRDWYEPDLERFRERYDAGTLPSSSEYRDLTTDEAPALTVAEYRALTPEQKQERLRAQQRAYCRRRYQVRKLKGWKS